MVGVHAAENGNCIVLENRIALENCCESHPAYIAVICSPCLTLPAIQLKPEFVWGNTKLHQSYPRHIQSTVREIRLSCLRHQTMVSKLSIAQRRRLLEIQTPGSGLSQSSNALLITHRSTGRPDTIVARARLMMERSRLRASKSLHHATRRLCHDTGTWRIGWCTVLIGALGPDSVSWLWERACNR